MTIPGLSMFYAGMVRSKNVLSVMMQCFTMACLMSILWVVAGYSIAFGAEGPYWGGLDNVFLLNLTVGSMSGTIPESLFMTFQMTFAIITPALMVGAFAERIKFRSMLLFMSLWLILIYAPICHWVWGDGGWLGNLGILDFAGGTVVHINAGMAGLVAAIVVGKRSGYGDTVMMPHNLTLTIIGASMLWVGWFGFNAGSELAADNVAAMAMAVTQIAAAAAAMAWMTCEFVFYKKTSVLGIASGAVAGLVAITPASGAVGPLGALFIGGASGTLCFFAATRLKKIFGYDDSLDVFGVHGVGGIIGAILTGIFCAESLGGAGFGVDGGMMDQLLVQATGVIATIIYTGIASYILLKVVDQLLGLRVLPEEEDAGLDITSHNERAYNL